MLQQRKDLKEMSNSPKYRDFFITINEGSPCYEDVLDIIHDLNYKIYALITHDKDKVYNIEKQCYEPKKTHKHLMMEMKNPVSFNKMQERFKGAHIEIPKYKKSAYQYLLHNSPKSKGEKYQYDFNEIITNSPQELKVIIESETFELFKENMFLEYIADGTRTSYQFAKRFGLNAYKQYWKPYLEMIMNLANDEEMQHDLELIIQAREEELPF